MEEIVLIGVGGEGVQVGVDYRTWVGWLDVGMWGDRVQRNEEY